MFTAAFGGVLGSFGRILLLSVPVQFARSLLLNQHLKTVPFFQDVLKAPLLPRSLTARSAISKE
jgi:hypothetical protein